MSYPSPSGFSKRSEPLRGFTPTREGSHSHAPLDSHPSGRESPSESTLFGSAVDQVAAASADSPWLSRSKPSMAAPLTSDHWYSQRLARPSRSASQFASSARFGSSDQLLPPVKLEPTHRRWVISQPSGIPSPSESKFVGSVPMSVDDNPR